MRLRTKTLLVIGATLSGLIGVLYATSSTILLSSLRQAEEQNTQQVVKAVLNNFSQTADDFSSRFSDWSAWDDTYTFIEDNNKQFIKSNLGVEQLTSLKVNLILFIKNSGQIVYGTGIDPKTQKIIPVPAVIKKHLNNNNLLLNRPNPNISLTGILLLPEGPMLITSQPILTSEGTGPIRGNLIFGRYLDSNTIEKLSKITLSSLSFYNINNSQISGDFKAARKLLSSNKPILVRPLNENTVGGYTWLKDIYGKPALLLRVALSREVYQQGKKNVLYLIISVLVVGIVFGGITLLLLERLVLSRLGQLSFVVKSIGNSGDLSTRILTTGNDELANLSENINGMLEALQYAQYKQKESEEKYRKIFENTIDGIFQTTPDGRYINVNPSLARLYGYSSPQELITNITDISKQIYVNPNRRNELITAIEKYGSVSQFESQVYRQNKSIIWISENVRAVYDNQGKLLCYEGTAEDISERKVAQEALRFQQEQSERLLLNILPEPIAKRLKMAETTIAESFANVTVLFADIVGFTEIAGNIPPTELVNLLNKIFSAFDYLAEKHGLEKIKTIGDAYMVVGGLPIPRSDHAEAIAEMALEMQAEINKFATENGKAFNIRIGINSGPVVAGVIGIKKFIYDLWGDTVNIASRMEAHGIPGSIQVTASTYEILQDKYQLEERGIINVKGKGEMKTYLLKNRKYCNLPVSR